MTETPTGPQSEIGEEWLMDIVCADRSVLASVDAIRSALGSLLTALQLTTVSGPHLHQFPGAGGCTGIVLLAESHLAIHTWPEHAAASVNLFLCGRRDPDAVTRCLEDLGRALTATSTSLLTMKRGSANVS